MPFLRPKPDTRRQLYLALVNKLESQLRELYSKRSDEGYTLACAADRLGIHRSLMTRRLNGQTNMTLETVAEMVWAGGGAIDVDVYDPKDLPPSNGPRIVHEPVSYEPHTEGVSIPTKSVVTFSSRERVGA